MKIRKVYVQKNDFQTASPEELTSVIVEKSISNREGWTLGAAVDANVERLHKGEWSKGELVMHRSGRKKGAYGIVRKTIVELAHSCRHWPSMVDALKLEAHREAKVMDVNEIDRTVSFRHKEEPIKFATIMDYFDTAKGWPIGTTRARDKIKK